MVEDHHKQLPIQIWVDVDEEIAETVIYLNSIPGVRTHASCQGTIGEGGAHPYRAQVMVTWDSDATFDRLRKEFDVTPLSGTLAYVHPRR